MIRDIVIIDEHRCDGCGRCVPACTEGAIRIVDGKARLVSDRLCDGLGACLGHCPQNAIRIVRREAEVFDHSAVTAAPPNRHELAPGPTLPATPRTPACPGARFRQFRRAPAAVAPAASPGASPAPAAGGSELTHWPVQLRLLSSTAPVLRGARLLLVADCVPVAYPEFHRDMLRGRAVLIACPKLDETSSYLEKLTEIIRANDPAEIIVAHMEVPCCTGLLTLAIEARRRSGRTVPLVQVIVGTQGEVITRREIPAEAA